MEADEGLSDALLEHVQSLEVGGSGGGWRWSEVARLQAILSLFTSQGMSE
jgi:hypothetical protein